MIGATASFSLCRPCDCSSSGKPVYLLFHESVEIGEMMEEMTMYAYEALDVQVRRLMECRVYLSAS